MSIKALTLNSFTSDPSGGNPAGVVMNADNLTVPQMKEIASKVGFSETAFVMKSNSCDFKVRFFTPVEEVDLCGHATIAAFHALNELNIIGSGVYTQETLAGNLEVEVFEDGLILMDQSRPVFYETIDPTEISDSLGIPESYLSSDLPIQIVSTGLKDIMVPLSSVKALYHLEPKMNVISSLSEKYGVTGYHVFTTETEEGFLCECRNFAPLYGIDEESATGTSNGALISYMYKYGVINKDNMHDLVIKQGYSMGTPSQIYGKLFATGQSIDRVRIGGKAVITGEILL